jgi:hypothetical protein
VKALAPATNEARSKETYSCERDKRRRSTFERAQLDRSIEEQTRQSKMIREEEGSQVKIVPD